VACKQLDRTQTFNGFFKLTQVYCAQCKEKLSEPVMELPEIIELEKQVCFSLYSASNSMIRAYRPLLNKLDLTYLQYMAMIVLWNDSPLNVKEIGRKLNLDSGTLTPLLKRLDQKGLVNRTRSNIDERVRPISVTEQGQALRQQATDVPNEIRCKVKLSLEDTKELKRLCDLINVNLHDIT